MTDSSQQPSPSASVVEPPRGKLAALYAMLAPGMVVAATGVGAGDLLTAGLAGSTVGLAILWSAVAGAFLKFILNEGLARWQMATGTTLLEGWCEKLGSWMQYLFLLYLSVWSLAVGAALINACGVAGHAMLPLGDDPQTSRAIWAIVHSLAGTALVLAGGFAVFEGFMSICVGVMFVTVILTAVLVQPDWAAAARGLAVPTIPEGGTVWVVGVLGGVGGTVSMMSYNYWIRERGRTGAAGVRVCRVDLAVGYIFTGLFGAAMILMGSRLELEGKGDMVALGLAENLAKALGPLGGLGKWMFLIGFWAAVFTSVVGVWQGTPYLFSDLMAIRRGVSEQERRAIDFSGTWSYRWYLIALTFLPMLLLGRSVKEIQLTYAVLGALFIPLLAATLLVMNNRADWVGREFRNGWMVNLSLAAAVAFFGWAGGMEIVEAINRARR